MKFVAASIASIVSIVVIGGGSTQVARADEDFADATVIFARGSSLYQVDAKGKGETEIAQLPAKVVVRALRSDANGSVLLADLAGKWAWLPLDGSTKSLTDLPCADGPAQLAEDGACVLCRALKTPDQSIIVNLKTGKSYPIQVPAPGTRLAGTGADRKLVWADANGVWSSPPGDPKKKTQVAPDAPLRGFLPSPDGSRAIGVFSDTIYVDARHTKAADVLMTFQLDSQGARRKAIRDGVVIEWSHDSQWLLVQDNANACLMRATGGQYKCWRGYTGASISSDGRWGLVLGNRDGSKKQTPVKPKKPPKKTDKADEPTDEPEDPNAGAPIDDVSVAPPSGPLALYRTRLEGAFTDSPTLLVKVVDGAAVWVPKAP